MILELVKEECDHCKSIVIDVGHFHFVEDNENGGIKACSSTCLDTVIEGVNIAKYLNSKNIKNLIHICASDTNKYISKEDREKYASYHGKVVTENDFTFILPPNIASHLKEHSIRSFLYTSQVKNTNSATGIIRKAKKLFKKSESSDGFLTHYLATRGGNNFFGYFSGLESSDSLVYHGNSAEGLRSKSIIGLYGDKGTLCPASCMGMYNSIYQSIKDFDYIISIYDESDDFTIKKKLFQGCLSYSHLTNKPIKATMLIRDDLEGTLKQIDINISKESLSKNSKKISYFTEKHNDTMNYYGLSVYSSKKTEQGDLGQNGKLTELDCGCETGCNIL